MAIGSVDPLSLVKKKEGPTHLALGGRSWRVTSVDVARQRVFVEPTAEKGASRWMGQARGLSHAIASAIKKIFVEPDSVDSQYLTKRSAAQLQDILENGDLEVSDLPVSSPSGGYQWWTYAGLAGNRLLAARIAAVGGTYNAVDSYSICFKLSSQIIEQIGGWRSIPSHSPIWSTPDPDSVKFGKLIPAECLLKMDLARVQAQANG